MSPGEKVTPGITVSPAELNDLIRRVRDLRTHVETNKRHLNTIDGRLTVLEVHLDALKDALDLAEAEEEEDARAELGPVLDKNGKIIPEEASS